MNKRLVLIVGNGKLAAELLGNLGGAAMADVTRWEDRPQSPDTGTIVVHAGSGRQWEQVLAYCAATGSTLLELSTSGSPIPVNPSFPLIVCPNVNLLVLDFLAMLKASGSRFGDCAIAITESHQASKKTAPGTARYIANVLGVAPSRIISVRDPCVQQQHLGIAPEFLDRHALHRIVISNQDAQLVLESRVLGKVAYAAGLGRILDALAEQGPGPGAHDVVALLAKKGSGDGE